MPFVVQIVAAVGLTGWLSVRNGQEAINELAPRLSQAVTRNIETHVREYTNTPHVILQVQQAMVQAGNINLEDFDRLKTLFWLQARQISTIDLLYFGNPKGDFIGVGRLQNGGLTELIRDRTTNDQRQVFSLDERGKRLALLKSSPYDSRTRIWYKTAEQKRQAAWSPIYMFAARPILGITAVQPIYGSTGDLLGVFAFDVTLSQLSDFLRSLKISETGQAFVIEASGNLVATSTAEPPFMTTATGQQQIKAIQSNNQMLRAVALQVTQKFPDLTAIQQPEQVTVDLGGDRQFVQITRITDLKGLDWFLVVVVPERDFIDQINANTRSTILLCGLALVLATIVGIFTSRWIAQPILRLRDASRAIAQGELNQTVKVESVQELAALAVSFNQMAGQLQESFTALAQSNEALEQKVEQRTLEYKSTAEALQVSEAALKAQEAYLRLILNNIPQQVFWKDTDLVFRGCNKNWAIASEIDDSGFVIGKTDYDLLLDREMAEEFRAQDRYILETNTPQLHIVQAKVNPDQEGKTVWLDISKIPIQNDRGEVIGILGVLEDITERKLAQEALQIEQEKSEQLLLNVLPKAIADQLKEGQSVIADSFEAVTVLFADLVNFTNLSAELSPQDVVSLLNLIFSTFDRLCATYGLEKIKTIGDAYMVAGGVPVPRADHAEAIAEMALDMLGKITELQVLTGKPLEIRVGINTGMVVAGVIGTRKFIYDLWGDTVNIASRMESQGEMGKIQVTEQTYAHLNHKYEFEERGAIAIKGRGAMPTYWLLGRKSQAKSAKA
ncbi:adenylate/guanylate cyclase domain-containing protein [Tumidithrix elongata RA019]|uniref:Adenylate cyclase n=1 Tax=Tumidithrix elongata BACA0141 TaxID=2716417 RepID=A0AAW9Q6F1_9CYAN|nr:adenylate/guanylate cyclase domain-containing protein [Tumidithrix elongata RA019]